MNKHFNTKGVIIRKTDFNEADRIVTVLTADDGKIDCIAKGARRNKSRFCGRLDLFSHVSMTCFRGKSLHSVVETELIDAFGDTKDLDAHRTLFYLSEFTQRVIQNDQQIDGVYPLILETFSHVQRGKKLDTALHSYLIKLLTFSGFLSPWKNCGRCFGSIDLEKAIRLSATDAGVLCPNCATASDRLIDPVMVKWIYFLQKQSLSDAAKVCIDADRHENVWQWLQGIIADLISSPLRSDSFLRVRI